MKNIFILLCTVFTLTMVTSIKGQHTKLPPFIMEMSNHQIFKTGQLPYGKPIVLIYFLPDCTHCQLLTSEIIKHIKEFNKASVAMVTYYPAAEVGRFVQKYGLDKYDNFYIGTESTGLFLKHYYHLTSLPFMALYTKNGDLVRLYHSEKDLTDLLQRLKAL